MRSWFITLLFFYGASLNSLELSLLRSDTTTTWQNLPQFCFPATESMAHLEAPIQEAPADEAPAQPCENHPEPCD